MIVKTSELTGAALDWAVAMAENWAGADFEVKPYCTDWSQGGPIIEQKKIDVMWCGDRWCAYTMTPHGQQLITDGDTPLLAAMRGLVVANLGDEIDLPADLALDCLTYETGDE